MPAMAQVMAPAALEQPALEDDSDAAVDAERGVSVTERPRPDFEPEGLRVGTFLLFPQLGLEERYDSNIYSQRDDTKHDFISRLQPELRLESDWGIHSLNFRGTGDIGFYKSHTSENYEDGELVLTGRLDTYEENNIVAEAAVARDHEERSDPNDSGGKNPTIFRTAGLELSYFHRWTLLSVRTTGSVKRHDYDDVETLTSTINNDDRDRYTTVGAIRVDYDVDPEIGAFIGTSVKTEKYDSSRDDLGYRRDLTNVNAEIGMRMDLTGVVFAEIYAGLIHTAYKEASFSDSDGVNFGGQLFWEPSGDLSISSSLERSVNPTTIAGSGSELTTQFALLADHEIEPNLILSPTLFVTQTEFENIDRSDWIVHNQLELRYLLNKYMHIIAGLEHRQRFSSDSTFDFTQNIARVKLNLML